MNTENLTKLARYLLAGETAMNFQMNKFCENKYSGDLNPSDSYCGTVACSLGHAPSAGIEPYWYETWTQYERRVFGLAYEEYRWCFSGHWVHVDNTPQGAAKRILWMVKFGVPKGWLDQMYGTTPLCYGDMTLD